MPMAGTSAAEKSAPKAVVAAAARALMSKSRFIGCGELTIVASWSFRLARGDWRLATRTRDHSLPIAIHQPPLAIMRHALFCDRRCDILRCLHDVSRSCDRQNRHAVRRRSRRRTAADAAEELGHLRRRRA